MFGYIKYHYCPHSTSPLTEQWKEGFYKHNIIGTIAIDSSKALIWLFTTPSYFEKLKLYGLGDRGVSLIRSYLSLRYQIVKLGAAFSAWQEASRGTYIIKYIHERFNVRSQAAELSTLQMIQLTFIVPTKMFVLFKTTLISILRIPLYGLFTMAWNLTQINTRLYGTWQRGRQTEL